MNCLCDKLFVVFSFNHICSGVTQHTQIFYVSIVTIIILTSPYLLRYSRLALINCIRTSGG